MYVKNYKLKAEVVETGPQITFSEFKARFMFSFV